MTSLPNARSLNGADHITVRNASNPGHPGHLYAATSTSRNCAFSAWASSAETERYSAIASAMCSTASCSVVPSANNPVSLERRPCSLRVFPRATLCIAWITRSCRWHHSAERNNVRTVGRISEAHSPAVLSPKTGSALRWSANKRRHTLRCASAESAGSP